MLSKPTNLIPDLSGGICGTQRRARLLTIVWFAGGLVGCAAQQAQPSSPTPPISAPAEPRPAPTEQKPVSGAQLMQAAFWTAVQARNALIAGDLARARVAAETLAARDYSAAPEPWQQGLARLRDSTQQLSASPTLDDAARALGRVAQRCAECHAEQGSGPVRLPFVATASGSAHEQLAERMDRHQAGVEQMWNGLIAASEQLWRSGTLTLLDAPLLPPSKAGQPLSPTLQARMEQVRSLAQQGKDADSYAERARVYGELIASCAACHSAAGR